MNVNNNSTNNSNKTTTNTNNNTNTTTNNNNTNINTNNFNNNTNNINNTYTTNANNTNNNTNNNNNRYSGSTTVTRCTEGVERIVFRDPISVSPKFVSSPLSSFLLLHFFFHPLCPPSFFHFSIPSLLLFFLLHQPTFYLPILSSLLFAFTVQ